ncbi:hypothetical protein FA95DRAFT_1646603 [Auriscalpium vulgare]|uniref:Uncharacterized protein n=1 Tax=Auriscalpium vulgare TaxID=40419 RepID=A0ACB8S050_9AGAM|nr:hypothetical protein FA95DRAFT_1646603 [Auriscalpium vulgare]
MSAAASPLHAAHQHAANADDFTAQGLLIPAAEQHLKAADAFQACIEASNDENTKRTLRMLHNEHSKAGKDTERRIAKLRSDGVDPALPQKPVVPRPSSVPSHLAPKTSPSPPPHLRGRLIDSQVDESFMLLGQQSTDAGDAFNLFWRAMEALDNVSQPVAFATTPLGLTDSAHGRNGSSSSDTDPEDNARSRRTLTRGQSRTLSPDNSFATAYGGDDAKEVAKSSRVQQSVIDLRNDFDEIAEEDYDSSDSFCLVPSKSEPSTSTLKKENASLHSDLEAVRKQLEAAERMLKLRKEQDQHLRDNIAVARREAQRAMGASLTIQRNGQSTFDLSNLNLNLPPLPPPPAPTNAARDRETQLVRRTKELEEELRTVRVENEKQKAMIAKFRERWDKLKESAKRKKDAKVAAEALMAPVRERIDEEPEAEADQDQDEQHL